MQNYKEQRKTLTDLRHKLNYSNKCLVIRPTGFGKTYLLADLIGDQCYKSVLYVYPTAVVLDTLKQRCADNYNDADITFDPETLETIERISSIDKVDPITYAKFCRLTPDHLASTNYDLVIFDEAHRLGGYETKKASRILMETSPKTRFVGATATPDRMDGFDIISQFFNDVTTYEFSIDDCIAAGILQKPEYVYCTCDMEGSIKIAVDRLGGNPSDKAISNIITAEAKEAAELFNMPGIIRSMCDKYAKNRDYMKFIVFFADIKHMDAKIPEVVSWFKAAFKSKNNRYGYDINTLRISSLNSKETKNTRKLKDLVPVTNTVDLICCVDMLNMGYHVSDLTGIMMYRGTSSNTIFIQQLGRALSAGSEKPPIVFDVVDNLHRKPVYDLKAKPGKGQGKLVDTGMVLGSDGITIVIDTGEGEVPTHWQLDPVTGDIIDIWGEPALDLVLDAGTGIVYQRINKKKRDRGITKNTVLFVQGTMPDFDEIAARIIDYPIIRRCREALYLHSKRFFDDKSIISPLTWQNLSLMMPLTNQDFENQMKSLLIPAGYPADDPEEIRSYGLDRGIDFLGAIAKLKSVTPEQVLFTLGYE